MADEKVRLGPPLIDSVVQNDTLVSLDNTVCQSAMTNDNGRFEMSLPGADLGQITNESVRTDHVPKSDRNASRKGQSANDKGPNTPRQRPRWLITKPARFRD